MPSLREEDVNVVLTVKTSTLCCLVNIVSYDIAVRMAVQMRERRFQAVIAVRPGGGGYTCNHTL